MVHAAFPLQIVKNQGIQRGPDGKEYTYGVSTKFVKDKGGDFNVNTIITRSDGALFEYRLNDTQDDLILYSNETGGWDTVKKENGKAVAWGDLPPTRTPIAPMSP